MTLAAPRTLYLFTLLTVLAHLGCAEDKTYCDRPLNCDDAAVTALDVSDAGHENAAPPPDGSAISGSMGGTGDVPQEYTLPGQPPQASGVPGAHVSPLDMLDAGTGTSSLSLDSLTDAGVATSSSNGAGPTTEVKSDAGTETNNANAVATSPDKPTTPTDVACDDLPACDGELANQGGLVGACEGLLNTDECASLPSSEDVDRAPDGGGAPATSEMDGSLEIRIYDAETGAPMGNAMTYIAGYFDPLIEDCGSSNYCAVSGLDGTANLAQFPPGPQRAVVAKDGFEPIAIQLEIAPSATQQVELNMLRSDLNESLTIVLSWSVTVDLDLVLSVPAESDGGEQCVFGTGTPNESPGDLEGPPYAQLQLDGDGHAGHRTETLLITLDDDSSGPHYDGTYRVVVNSWRGTEIASASPSVRLLRPSESGAADIDLFSLPADAVDDVTGWHVFDLQSDGTVTPGGATEYRDVATEESTLSVCTTKSIEYTNAE